MLLLRKIKDKMSYHIYLNRRKKWLKKIRTDLKNQDFTIICNNCIAGVIYSDLGLQFKSPTINLYMMGEEYLNFVKNLKIYISSPLNDITESEGKNFPVGEILPENSQYPSIRVFFQHYQSFDEAKECWERRCKRVNFENIYYIWEFFSDAYEVSLLEEFDELPINKVALLHESIDGINNCYIFKYKRKEPGDVLKLIEQVGKRHLDEFDYVKFLNSEMTKNF